MKKVAVIGHFGGNREFLDGQTVKTKIVTSTLVKALGEEDVTKIDTYGGKKNLLKLPFRAFSALKNHSNVVILPAQNGLKVLSPILIVLNKLFHRKLHYCVIGGWLASYLENKKSLAKKLKKFNGVYVETSTMKEALEKMGFENIFVMPNCKELSPLDESQLVYSTEEPLKVCTFSRVMKEKGIEDAVNAVNAVNEKAGRTVYALDIYGQVDPSQTEWFENLKDSFPEYINYGGLVPFDKSVEVLKDYFALLFPTRFYTEGIPGTFIDAYSAAVPVITSLWLNYPDIFEEGVSGWGYDFDKPEILECLLRKAAEAPNEFLKMKRSALSQAKKFSPDMVISVLTKNLD